MKREFLELGMGIFLLFAVFFLAREGAKMVFVEQNSGKMISQKTEEGTEEAKKEKTEENVVVIDPGHGGSDPGKIGIHGEKEKDINLQIAMLAKERLEKLGISVVMTRESDQDLAGEGQGSRKARDLKKRCELIDQTVPVCAISIHQNSYTQEPVRGAQTFYYANSKEGGKLAELIQECLVKELDVENHRMAKGNTGYYMLKKTRAPLVIVECGFLSNEEESRLLTEKAYQEKVAAAICKGVFSYINGEKNDKNNGK